MSLLLNLVNTFLKMVDTYIIVLIADDYSLNLGVATTYNMWYRDWINDIFKIFSLAYFSAWSNK